MNEFIKLIVFIWLMFCALFVWVGLTIVALFLTFTDWPILYSIAPFIGITAAFCIIKCAMYVLLKSNPIMYMVNIYDRFEVLIGKKKA